MFILFCFCIEQKSEDGGKNICKQNLFMTLQSWERKPKHSIYICVFNVWQNKHVNHSKASIDWNSIPFHSVNTQIVWNNVMFDLNLFIDAISLFCMIFTNICVCVLFRLSVRLLSYFLLLFCVCLCDWLEKHMHRSNNNHIFGFILSIWPKLYFVSLWNAFQPYYDVSCSEFHFTKKKRSCHCHRQFMNAYSN